MSLAKNIQKPVQERTGEPQKPGSNVFFSEFDRIFGKKDPKDYQTGITHSVKIEDQKDIKNKG